MANQPYAPERLEKAEDQMEPVDWTGFHEDASNFLWNMPDGSTVRAIPVSDEKGVIWSMWVQKGPFMYCPFSVGIEDFSDPEGNPEFERCAWSAWHDAALVMNGMMEAARQTMIQLNDADFEVVFDEDC